MMSVIKIGHTEEWGGIGFEICQRMDGMGVFPCEGREGSLEQRYGWDGARVGGGKGIWRA